jgi:hypothetical protein
MAKLQSSTESSCINKTFHHCKKTLDKTTLGEKHLFYLTVSEVSVHYGGKDVTEQSTLYHGSQEAKREWLG